MNVVGANIGVAHTRSAASLPRPRELAEAKHAKQPRRKLHAEEEREFLQQVEERRAMLERQDSSGNFKAKDEAKRALQRQSSHCLEFFEAPKVSLIEDLRRKFDPTGRGLKESPAFYSDAGLMRRESLKYDPMILRTLEELWNMIDGNNNGVMDKEEYREFHSKLALVLIPSVSFRQSESLFNEDWERDTDCGRKAITRTVFGDSMFELADRWTDEISAPDYIAFLQGTFQALSEIDPTGRRVYKSEKALREMRLTQSPLSRLHALSLQEARARAAAEERARARAFREGREFDMAAFEAEWELRRGLANFGASSRSLSTRSGSSRSLLGKQGSQRGLRRNRTGLGDLSLSSSLSEEELGRRHTLGGPIPNKDTSNDPSGGSDAKAAALMRRGSSKSIINSSESALTPEEIEARNAAAARQAERFYPPPKSWWARHARSRSSGGSRSSNQAPIHSQLVLGPDGQDHVGVVLFDPLNPDSLFRLVVSGASLAVETSELLPLSNALESCEDQREDGDALIALRGSNRDAELDRSRAEAAGSEATFEHRILRSDWLTFCSNVNRLTSAVRGPNDSDLSFVGFTSAYNPATGRLCSNFHFDADEVASRLTNLGRRPRLGLACPALQSKIAKYVVHRLRLAMAECAAQERVGMRRTESAGSSTGLLRSASSQRLLRSLEFASEGGAARHLDSAGGAFMSSISSAFDTKAHERLNNVLDARQERAFRGAEKAEAEEPKRHSLGSPLDSAERERKKALLVSRGRARLMGLGSSAGSLGRSATEANLPKLQKQLSVPTVVCPEMPTIRLSRNYHKIF